MDEQQRHSASDSSSSSGSGMSDSSPATGAMAAAASPSLSSPPAPRPTLQRMLSIMLHADPTLSAIRRALPPLPLPPEPQPPNPMLLLQQQTGAGGSAGGVGAGAGAAAATASTVLGASAISLPPSPLPALSAPIVSVEAVLAAAMAATAAEGSSAAAAAFAPLHPSAITGGVSAAAAATRPVSAVPLAAIPVAASVVTAASTGRARSPGDAAAAGDETNAKESLIQSMLTRPPFSTLGDEHYRSTVLRHYLHELPHAQLFQLAWRWSFYCDFRLDELKDTRKRDVKTSTRAWILRVDPKGKGRGMRPFVFLANLLQNEISRRFTDATLAQQGHRLVQTDMDPRIGLVLQQLVGRFLLPATLIAEFHVVIRDAERYPSAAVAFLQQSLGEAGVDLNPKEFKWSLVYLLEQACDVALPPARAAAIIGQLCNLLVQEGVHVPKAPASTIKEFVLQLLWCNMLVEYSDAINFERWLRQQGHPLADLPHLLEQQTASMRSTPMFAQTVSRLDSAFAGPIAASSSCSAPPVSASQLSAPAAGDAAAGGPAIASASRSNSAPLVTPMPQSLRTASDYLPSPPPLPLDQAAAAASMAGAMADVDAAAVVSTSGIRSSLPALPSLEFDDRDLDRFMDSSNPNQ